MPERCKSRSLRLENCLHDFNSVSSPGEGFSFVVTKVDRFRFQDPRLIGNSRRTGSFVERRQQKKYFLSFQGLEPVQGEVLPLMTFVWESYRYFAINVGH